MKTMASSRSRWRPRSRFRSWAWADWSGYTKKKAVQKENEKKQARIDKSRESLGMKKRRR